MYAHRVGIRMHTAARVWEMMPRVDIASINRIDVLRGKRGEIAHPRGTIIILLFVGDGRSSNSTLFVRVDKTII